jgi:hypothetical protein
MGKQKKEHVRNNFGTKAYGLEKTKWRKHMTNDVTRKRKLDLPLQRSLARTS